MLKIYRSVNPISFGNDYLDSFHPVQEQTDPYVMNRLYVNDILLVNITPNRFLLGVQYLASNLHDPAIFVLL